MSLIEVRGLSASHAEGTLKNVDLTLEKGEILGVAGVKNSGLKFLSHILTGLYDGYQGEVRILGKEINKDRSYLENVGIFNTDIRSYMELTGLDMIRMTYRYKGLRPDEKEYRKYAEVFGLSDAELKKSTGKYSTYELASLDLLLSHLGNPEVILLQDPTTPLREFEKERLMETMKEENRNGRTYIVFSPFAKILEEICTRIIYLENGSSIDREGYFTNRQNEYNRNVEKLRGIES